MAEGQVKNTEFTLKETDVAQFLKDNPDFLTRNPDLFESLEMSHSSGPAVSLIERQVDLLRGKNQRLLARLHDLAETASANEQRANHVHKLSRALLRAPTLATIVSSLKRVMRDEFKIEEIFVGVHAPTLTRDDIEGLTRLDANHKIVKRFDNFFRTRLIECGSISEENAKLLFPKAKVTPKSAAIVPLEKDKGLGVVALGSAEADRFQPKQGKLFLEMTAELLSAALRARLG